MLRQDKALCTVPVGERSANSSQSLQWAAREALVGNLASTQRTLLDRVKYQSSWPAESPPCQPERRRNSATVEKAPREQPSS